MTDCPRIKALVLDAAPLLTQARIAGLAEKYYIPPSVLAELRDARARDYLNQLHATGQIDLEVRDPGAEALRKMIDFAKLTGDYAVLSPADLHVLALTYALEVAAHGTWRLRDHVGGLTGQQRHEAEKKGNHARSEKGAQPTTASTAPAPGPGHPGADANDAGFTVVDEAHGFRTRAPPEPRAPTQAHGEGDSTDDEATGGEWVTPDNITKHKNRALGIVVDESVAMPSEPGTSRRRRGRRNKRTSTMSVACMTGDFAVQNVLLQMGLHLVSVDGLRIERVKSWVLRCHACYKICKDNDRKFCPSCGNATLLRTSVSSAAPGSAPGDGMQVHLKPNFHYHNRGTVYSLPLPQPGSASGGRASGSSKNPHTGVPVLREDQTEWQRRVASERNRQRKEERSLQRALDKGQDSLSARYADPDWLPDLLTGAHTAAHTGLPALGVGRRNPNEARRRRR
ncbi:20S-pre-rRNA D-site endonuclease nob1 [Malassezia sp. CBS 17886]|nr:20S-pre-rRNA D-site endonuclease nob1 [Malassezia sp. CBS 17886]